jgi:hypothetical protein
LEVRRVTARRGKALLGRICRAIEQLVCPFRRSSLLCGSSFVFLGRFEAGDFLEDVRVPDGVQVVLFALVAVPDNRDFVAAALFGFGM